MKFICLLETFLFICSIRITDARAHQNQNAFSEGFSAGLQGGFAGLSGGLPGSKQNTQALQTLMQQCMANGGQSAFNEVEKSAINVQNCVAEVMPRIQTVSDKTLGGICTFIHSTVRSCLLDFSKKLERCMDKTTAYAPAFSMEIFDSIFKFLCKDDAKHIMTLMTSIRQPSECVQQMKDSMPGCATKMPSFKPGTTPQVYNNLTKSELCRETKVLKDCLIETSKRYCSGNNYDFVTGITNAVYEPCSSCRLFVFNVFILSIFVVFVKLF